MRFAPLSDGDVGKMLGAIAGKEGLDLIKSGKEAILYVSEGDMRKAINLLQSSAALGKKIDDELIYKVTAKARPEDIRRILQTAIEGDYEKARKELRQLVISYGMSGEDVVGQFHREVFKLPLSEQVKVKLVDTIGEYEFRIMEGANELIQLEALLSQFVLVGKET